MTVTSSSDPSTVPSIPAPPPDPAPPDPAATLSAVGPTGRHEAHGPATGQAVDFVLAGRIRVRVVGSGPADAAVVGRQLGLPPTAPEGDADLTVEVVDRLEPVGPLRLLGREEAGFDDDGFVMLRAKGKARTMARLPLDRLGQRPVITCERGLPAVPLLVPMLAVTALGRGLVPLHAGAFTWHDAGIVVTGWSKGGKTETVVASAAAGARYVGDEWCYLDGTDGTVAGIPEPVTLWAWHLRRFPPLRAAVPRADRARMALLDWPDRLERRLPASVQQRPVGRRLRRIAYHTRSRANVWLPPERLFGPGDGPTSVPYHHVVLAVSTAGAGGVGGVGGAGAHRADDVHLRPVAAAEIAARMAQSVRYELAPLLQAYRMFRYAFPCRPSAALDDLDRNLAAALGPALARARGWLLEHPAEVDLHRLADAVRPLAIVPLPEEP